MSSTPLLALWTKLVIIGVVVNFDMFGVGCGLGGSSWGLAPGLGAAGGSFRLGRVVVDPGIVGLKLV